METQVLAPDAHHTLPHAADVLRHGGLVAFPTDTVYGVAASIRRPQAVQQLYAIKGRPSEKAIAVLLASAEELGLVASQVSESTRRLAEVFWPGAVTLVVPRHPDLPREVSRLSTVGARVPDHPLALELLRRTGPLAVTSANRSGAPSSLNASDVLAALDERVTLVIDGGTVPGGRPSTVVDCTVDPPAILRPGPISAETIQAALEAVR